MTQSPALPDRFRDVEHLEEVMTTPSAALIAALENLPGDIIVLGVGGKIGPSLAQLQPHLTVAGHADPFCRYRGP